MLRSFPDAATAPPPAPHPHPLCRRPDVSWAAAAGEKVTGVDDFYTHPFCRRAFQAHIAVLLSRVNSLTGVAYRDDPHILGFDLVNEPRVASDPTGDVLHAWLAEMSAYVKNLDPRHLVSTGAAREGAASERCSGER